MNLQLKGKKALITGATAGIGYAIAELLLKEDAEIIITGTTTEHVADAIAQLKKNIPGAMIKGIAVDFEDVAQVTALLHQFDDVDILINNAGIFGEVPFEAIKDEDWFRIFEVNVMSGVRLSRHYFPKMLQKNEGRIIFISSESAMNIPEDMIHYGMSKTAQLAVSRGLAKLTSGTNVTVNCVLPGPTWSRGNARAIEKESEATGKSIAELSDIFFEHKRPTSLIQRFATVEEVANMVVYVASPLASATNGAALRVDGGVVNSII